MKYKFYTVNNKLYQVKIADYKIDWFGKSASKFQQSIKQFFHQFWNEDYVCEEFPCRPLLKNRFRLDIFNFTRKIAVECHGAGHIQYNPFFHKDENDFWDSVQRDRAKELFCESNGIYLIKIYPSNLPLTLKWLQEKHSQIYWLANQK